MHGKISQLLLIFCLLTSACAAPTPQAALSIPSASPSPTGPTQTPEPVVTPSQPGYPNLPAIPSGNMETSAAYPAMKDTQAAEEAAVALTETARPTNTPLPPADVHLNPAGAYPSAFTSENTA